MLSNVEIKEGLLKICKEELNKQLHSLINAMDVAQGEANEHIGAMESRYDSFKEEAQQRVSGFARQIDEKKGQLPLLSSINPSTVSDKVQHGSIVKTIGRNYFFSAYIFTDPVEVGGELYFPVGIDSPIGNHFVGKSAGDTVTFNENSIELISVF